MFCPSCGKPLSQDSVFCPICGTRLSGICDATEESPNTPILSFPQNAVSPMELDGSDEAIAARKARTQAFLADLVERYNTPGNSPKPPRSDGKILSDPFADIDLSDSFLDDLPLDEDLEKSNPRIRTALIAILFVLFLLSVVGNVRQHLAQTRSLENITTLHDEIRSLEEQIEVFQENESELEHEIQMQAEQIENTEQNHQWYDAIVRAASSGNVGYASEAFHVSDGIVVLREDSAAQTITLVTDWQNGSSFTWSCSGDAALLSFEEEEWYTSTTITISPKHKGINIVTFHRESPSETFKLLILVTD